MKSAKIAALFVMAVLACMAMAASASAVPVWEACEKGASGTKYTTNQCTEVSGSGEFGWKEIAVATQGVGHGTLKLTFEFEGVKAETTCESTAEGKLGPGVHSKTEHITITCGEASPCAAKSIKVEANGLPWNEELKQGEKGVEDKISGTEGEAKLTATCKIAGVTVKGTANAQEVPDEVDNFVESSKSFVLIDERPGHLKGSLDWGLASGAGVRI
ncbi:MAG TPA: hypothetical protein VNV42_12230 [Solirubrobacteraceae bacterium]|jgi:hypothetical protein|nr:hypothetical protein [Solirubrobacteraceae bacterium]